MRVLAFAALLLVPVVAHARRMDLPTLIDRARHGARVDGVRATADAARAKRAEVAYAWVPQVEVTALGGPSPRIECLPSAEECARTEPTETRIGFSGALVRFDARATMPLYTFGKLSSARRAADAGVRAADALERAAESDAAVDAARAYWGVKLARESMQMLEEGMGELDDEIARVEKALDKGTGGVTEGDRHRLRAVRAEVEARMSEARRGERSALAALRLLAGEDDADVDEAPFEPVEHELVAAPEARAAARERRPERRAADAAVQAAGELVAVERARWLPDLLALAQATFARSSSTDDPANAFYNDPFNVTSFTAGVVLRWTLDLGARPAKIAGARAEEARARAASRLAAQAVGAHADRAWADAADGRDRLAAARRGEKEARAWLAATLQAAAAGLSEPKDVADALLLYFTMRARALQATFDWNVGTLALERAMGGS